jgi:hypothetical protein
MRDLVRLRAYLAVLFALVKEQLFFLIYLGLA